jgi:hypothetical protein
VLAALGATATHATENGQLRALLGAPSYELTTPQFPGAYGQLWVQHYSADKLRGDDGKSPVTATTTPVGTLNVQADAEIRATVVVPRFTYITETLISDGRLGFSATLPLVHQQTDVRLSTTLPSGLPDATVAAVNGLLAQQSAARSGSKSGQGDLDLTAFVDWQGDEGRTALGVSVVAPTGSYVAGRAVNPGAGKFWTVRPLLIASRVWENGLELGLRATYSINTKNSDTSIRSGQYLHVDWASLYRVNDNWRAGLQGYVVNQFTADSGPGVADNGNKARVYAAGPMLAYQSESGVWALDFKVMKEFGVRNRPEGQISWLRLNLRLD